MDVIEAIRTRRSVRRFKADSISEKDLREILSAGIWAPSAGNLQSRKFIVLQGKAKGDFAKAETGGRFQFGNEPVVIVVCADTDAIGKYAERGRKLYVKLDCAAAIENMMLAARAKGIGSCWVGSFDEEKVHAALKLQKNLVPLSIVPFGYPAPPEGGQAAPSAPARKSIEEACDFRN